MSFWVEIQRAESLTQAQSETTVSFCPHTAREEPPRMLLAQEATGLCNSWLARLARGGFQHNSLLVFDVLYQELTK